MLQAKRQNGELIIIANQSRQKIEQLKREESFYCPVCQEKVMIRAGKIMIPHFAHYRETECMNRNYAEGPEHERGKLLLYQWLKRQHFKVHLEPYLPEIKQRPDILLEINTRKIVIEYQCARVPDTEIIKRNQGYLSIGITPIWLLGANLFRRIGKRKIKIDYFLRQFIHLYQFDKGPILYFFDPHLKQFLLFQDFYFITDQTATGKLSFSPLKNFTFLDLFQIQSLPKNFLFEIWKKEKHHWRLKPRNMQKGKEHLFHRWLYQQGLIIDYLPACIFLPVRGQFLLNTPLWHWQSEICLKLLRKLKVGSRFTLNQVRKVITTTITPPNESPLVYTPINPLQQYLHLLEILQIIKKVKPNVYVKKVPLTFHQTLHVALKEDIYLCDFLKQNKKEA